MPLLRRGGTPNEQAARLVEEHRRADLQTQRGKSYLVLGSDGYSRSVRAYRWDRLPEDLNVTDYDVVVLNFAAFEVTTLAEGFPPDRLPRRDAMIRMLFAAGTEVIAIGNPRTLIGPPPEGSTQAWNDHRVAADYWLPGGLGVEEETGATFDLLADEWDFYFRHLTRWRWFFTEDRFPYDQRPAHYLRPVTREADDLAIGTRPVAQTRDGQPIALEIGLQAIRTYRYNPADSPVASSDGIAEGRQVVAESSRLIWLPPPDKVSVDEAIGLILRDRYGIADEARAPDWAAGYVLPDEAAIEREVAALDAELEAVGTRLVLTRARAVQAAEPRKLLHAKGKEVLEPLVLDVLRDLGASVEEPSREGVEDGLVYYGGRAAAIEVKGTRNEISLTHVRQAVQWASDARLRDGVEHKPLIIGNPHCEEPPDKRGEPFAPNAKAAADNGGVALVTTSQLYEALRRKQEGTFDEAMFWRAVFDATGLVELPIPPTGSPAP